MTKTVLAKANPNLHGWLKLVEERFEYNMDLTVHTGWYVREPSSQDSGDVVEFETLAAAQVYYYERLAFWQAEPNWAAQAAYDERHGTDNGYAPWQRVEY